MSEYRTYGLMMYTTRYRSTPNVYTTNVLMRYTIWLTDVHKTMLTKWVNVIHKTLLIVVHECIVYQHIFH